MKFIAPKMGHLLHPVRCWVSWRRKRRARLIVRMLIGMKSGRCDAPALRKWCGAGFVQFYVVLAQLIEAGVVQKIPRWVQLDDGTLVRLPQYMLTASGRSALKAGGL